ncbi:bacillithiol biosynthesis cysteine-adding enzyme BshC [Marinoscillum furvescens]|uniref:Putative cysteine ligase BshC n=1 Tax=Marinoscillum furvescens DSM 4134 TaxID=1122208 RepID=A0A3D9L4E5_MARFU|nr:bacillithiol biosynthesis cysteine-adding enzyme BshC [Marinoscillum furvescens]RED98876.1 bacillithiol biosynthesis cysteine-adding enzyme BshC [Marinoscillum furvescens DSM 4134]
MKLNQVSLEDTECFAPIFIDYINQKEALKPFYQTFPKLENFDDLIKNRQLSGAHRATLVDVLTEQYGPLEHTEAVEYNIHSLSSANTYTVTTGHQLNIFTGPLYFIYKIVTVINACKSLKAKYPDAHFVPVYWMASEDHDFAEISHFNLFGKKYQWENDQTGPVGRMKPYSLNRLIDQLPEPVPLFEQAYLDHSTLADAVRYYVNELFGDQGLVVVDADHKKLKSLFAPIIEQELFESKSNELVAKASAELETAGYKNQAFSREINFFYMEDGLRERIVKEGDTFKVLNTEKTFSADEMRALIKASPEVFSPNVIMRPVYQEVILPNLAYAGGPSEIAYWLQLKGIFDHYQIAFPALMPRVFGLVVNKSLEKKVKKLKLSDRDLFRSTHKLKEAYLKQHGENGFGLESERAELAKVFEKIKNKAEEIDGSLTGFIGAEGAKSFKSLENIAKRLKKAEEQNNDTAMSQIDTIKEKLFPNDGLQERHDNFLTFQLNHPEFIAELLDKFDAFDFRFHILHDE